MNEGRFDPLKKSGLFEEMSWKMKIYRAKDYEAMSVKAASLLFAQVMLEPRSVLGLATGSTPIGMYRCLVEWYRAGRLDFGDVTTINLDEYCGLAPDDPQSYVSFMRENLFRHVNVKREDVHIPNGLAKDAKAECARYDEIICRSGGIDMQVLGIGHNGHIGFNEPGDCFQKDTHCVALSDSTIAANRRFFERESDVPRRAYTVGIRTIMRARRVLVLASGLQKAAIVKEAFWGPVTPRVPASILQFHGDVTLLCDDEALSLV